MDRMYSKYFTALHRKELNIVRDLVMKEGCLVNYQFGDSSFPIHIAAEKDYLDVLKFLIAANASVDFKNRHGQTALLLGISHRRIVQALIIAGAQVNLSDPHGRTALHLACAIGQIDTVTDLIEAGARVDAHDKWGRTPLHVTLLNITHNQSIAHIYIQVITVLLQKGCNVNQGDRQSSTPLFLAVAVGDSSLDIVKMLIAHGAYPDLPSRHKLTPLMLSVMKGYVKHCMLLLSHNCNVNWRITATKNSCLRTAVKKGYVNIARLIIAAGCDLTREEWLYQPWDYTIMSQSEMTLAWLRELQSTPQSLKHLSRSRIRETHGIHLRKYVEQIHYPAILKKYILLEDVIPEEITRI